MFLLDLRGPDFLKVYLAVLVVAWVLVRMYRRWLRGPDDDGGSLDPDLEPYEVVYLANGRYRAAVAAIANLTDRGILSYDEGTREVVSVNPEAEVPHPLERAARDAARSRVKVTALRDELMTVADNLFAEGLRARGLLVREDQERRAKRHAALVFALITVWGWAKVLVGINRHKPAAFLAVLASFTLVVALFFLSLPVRLTKRGEGVLKRIREWHAALNVTSRTSLGLTMHGTDLVLAVGLFGVGAAANAQLSGLLNQVAPPTVGGGDGGGGGGGDGGGSCGGGCGGCGGGGGD